MSDVDLTQEQLSTLYFLCRLYIEDEVIDTEGYWEDYEYEQNEDMIDKKELGRIIKAIKSKLPKDIIERIEHQIIVRKFSDWKHEPDDKVINIINKAEKNKNTVEMEYFSPDTEEVTKRKVDIYARNSRYLVGFCHLRNAIRKFRISRIMKIKLTENKYEIPRDFNKKDFL